MDSQRDGEAIVSRSAALAFWKDSTGAAALGKRFRPFPASPWYTVIGVAGDVRDTALATTPAHAVYFPEALQRTPAVLLNRCARWHSSYAPPAMARR